MQLRDLQSRALAIAEEETFSAPPVHLNRLARRLGVASITVEAELEGCVHLDVEPPRIVLDSRLGFNRRRFTLAHELGHVLAHRSKATRHFSSIDELERFCDRLAVSILLPERWVLPLVDLEWTLGELNGYADQASVSVAVLVNRLSDLGSHLSWIHWRRLYSPSGLPMHEWTDTARAGAKGFLRGWLELHPDTVNRLCDLDDGDHARSVSFVTPAGGRCFRATLRKQKDDVWMAFHRERTRFSPQGVSKCDPQGRLISGSSVGHLETPAASPGT